MDGIIEKVEACVVERCLAPTNVFGIGAWSHHIKSVVHNAVLLANTYSADLEVVTLAALLHDIASVTNKDYVEEHHVYGAQIAEQILLEYGYDDTNKIELIKKCILNHRGSVLKDKSTIEEICVADADAIAHFDNVPSLFSMVYKEKNMSIDEGAEFIKNKLMRSYQKLSDDSKKIYAQKYVNVMTIFETDIEKAKIK